MGNEALVERAQAGDRAALGEIYEKYADRLYDLCYRLLRDRDAAVDALQDTFVLVGQRFAQLQGPEQLRPWLYAIARHVSLRYRDNFGRASVLYSVVVRDAADDDEATDDGVPVASVLDDTAETLSVRDRLVLELHERHGFEGAALLAALGLRNANPTSLVERAHERFERAVGDANAVASLAAVAMLVRPPRADALDTVTTISARFGLSDEPWPDDGFPPPLENDERSRDRLPALMWAGGVVFIVLGLVMVLVNLFGNDGGSSVEATGAPTTAPTVPTSVSPTTRELVDATTVPAPTVVDTTVAGITESVPSTPTTRRRTTPTTRRTTPTTASSGTASTPTAAPATTAPRGTTPHTTSPPGTTVVTTAPPTTDPPTTDPPTTDPPTTDPPTTDPPPTDPPAEG